MRFRPMHAADPADFFAVSGWSSKTHHREQMVSDPPDTAEGPPDEFEATVVEGEPRVGERYRFDEEGQSILVEVTEVMRAHAGEELHVKGAVIGR